MVAVVSRAAMEMLRTMDGSEAMRLGSNELARRARLMATPMQTAQAAERAALPDGVEPRSLTGYERRSQRREKVEPV